MHRLDTLLMPEHTRKALLLGPPSVTIHDDGYMARQTLLVYL
jgi:hypothetical protein